VERTNHQETETDGSTAQRTILVTWKDISPLSRQKRILLYKSIIPPILNYGIELLGCVCKSSIAVIQRCQSKILRAIFDALWQVNNDMIHKDLDITTRHEVIHERSVKHRTLESHSNPLPQHLPRENFIRRLKRRWSADLKFGERDLLAGGELMTLVRPGKHYLNVT
jgi:hypothetical protein